MVEIICTIVMVGIGILLVKIADDMGKGTDED